MEEVKVGEYVRTKNGVIFKITGGNVDDYDIDISYYDLGYFEDGGYSDLDMFNYNDNGNFIREIVVKHSPNIIDLIEEGDYVNGYRILEKTKTKNNEMQICILKDNNASNWRTINNQTLKSIVTHEQFANIEYRIGENNE